jgi:hypothetical protein
VADRDGRGDVGTLQGLEQARASRNLGEEHTIVNIARTIGVNDIGGFRTNLQRSLPRPGEIATVSSVTNDHALATSARE